MEFESPSAQAFRSPTFDSSKLFGSSGSQTLPGVARASEKNKPTCLMCKCHMCAYIVSIYMLACPSHFREGHQNGFVAVQERQGSGESAMMPNQLKFTCLSWLSWVKNSSLLPSVDETSTSRRQNSGTVHIDLGRSIMVSIPSKWVSLQGLDVAKELSSCGTLTLEGRMKSGYLIHYYNGVATGFPCSSAVTIRNIRIIT